MIQGPPFLEHAPDNLLLSVATLVVAVVLIIGLPRLRRWFTRRSGK